MSRRRGIAAAAVVAAAVTVPTVAFAGAASATVTPGRDAFTASVFVQTNAAGGNAVLAYDRSPSGALSAVGSFPTGGRGAATGGAPTDPLASQGSLTADREHGLLYAVNAGSNSITVFGVHGTRLEREQILPSGGTFPVSVTVSGRHVYVLNAGGTGSVSGFRLAAGRLQPIGRSTRSLDLPPAPQPPFFLSSPAQIGASPDGRDLVVTTKNNGDTDVFRLAANGRPAQTPTRTHTGPVPFPFVFDSVGRLVLADASGAAGTWRIQDDGTLTPLSAAGPNGQAATCWLAEVNGYFYAANTGSATITGYTEDRAGNLSLLDADGVTARTDAGPIDLAGTTDGRFLYQLNGGAGTASIYRVARDGALTRTGTVTGLPVHSATNPGMEGIVVT